MGAERSAQVLNTWSEGVHITALDAPLRRHDAPTAEETHDLLAILDTAITLSRPDVLITYGGDPITLAALQGARIAGIRTVFVLHNFQYEARSVFNNVDRVIVPSRFAAEHYREALGLRCMALPYLIDLDRVRVDRHEPKYLTFVNPSPEKGVFVVARIAEELGRRRPDIPILVVEGRSGEAALAACGLDLRVHGNVFLMGHTHDPRRFFRVSRLVVMPSLWRESQGLVAVEAMVNGIPVIASDRGALPETLGGAGVVLPLPERLTPMTRILPTPEEVGPWVEAIIRLWDDAEFAETHRRRALAEARRWAPETLGPRYLDFFESVRSGTNAFEATNSGD